MAKTSEGEYTVAATAGGVRVLEGEIIKLDLKAGVLHFKYKQFGKSKRVQETIPLDTVVYVKGEVGKPKAEVAYNSPGFSVAEFVGVTGVSDAGSNMSKGTVKDVPLWFNTRFTSLSTPVASTPKTAKSGKIGKVKKTRGEKTAKVKKTGKAAKAGKVKTPKPKGKKLGKAKWA